MVSASVGGGRDVVGRRQIIFADIVGIIGKYKGFRTCAIKNDIVIGVRPIQ